MTTLFKQIEQRVLVPATSPLILEIVTDFANERTSHPCHWFLEWAQNQPNNPFFTYWVNGSLIGFVHDHEATYSTLAEFVETYDAQMDQFWVQIQGEIEDYLDTVDLLNSNPRL